ncbi:MAG: N-acetylmuramoyl-L-alanine amidase [Candidatus Woesearchaeota archaeon]|nr:N-acetylmuramoyl-L-alanine amidase [Candidatus Woesearchaeota archaeon]
MKVKKKGVIVYSIIKIVVSVSFALLLLWFAKEKGSQIDFEKVYLAHDVALTIDALHGIPGNAIVDYDNKYIQQFKNRYDISVIPYLVHVSRHSENAGNYVGAFPAESVQGLESTYPYGGSSAYPLMISLQAPSYFAFILSNGKIDVVTKREIIETGCTQIQTSADITQQIILFEPGHYASDKGNTGMGLEEYRITKQIADSAVMQCKAKGYQCRAVQQQELSAKISEIKDTNKNMIISIHIGSSESGQNEAIIRFPSSDEKSSKLSCIMANKLRPDFYSVTANSIDINSIKDEDPLKVLGSASPGPALSLEMGNINDNVKEKFFSNPDNVNKAASDIIAAIEEYYK